MRKFRPTAEQRQESIGDGSECLESLDCFAIHLPTKHSLASPRVGFFIAFLSAHPSSHMQVQAQ